MPGPIATAMRPETAPAGMVTVMELFAQATVGIAVSFSMTVLLPCEAPKFEPVITNWLPIIPVVEESAVITGGVIVEVLRATLSKLAVPPRLLRAMPM